MTNQNIINTQEPCGQDVVSGKAPLNDEHLVGPTAVACAFNTCNAMLALNPKSERIMGGICVKYAKKSPYEVHILQDDEDEHFVPTPSTISPAERQRIREIVETFGKYD